MSQTCHVALLTEPGERQAAERLVWYPQGVDVGKERQVSFCGVRVLRPFLTVLAVCSAQLAFFPQK